MFCIADSSAMYPSPKKLKVKIHMHLVADVVSLSCVMPLPRLPHHIRALCYFSSKDIKIKAHRTGQTCIKTTVNSLYFKINMTLKFSCSGISSSVDVPAVSLKSFSNSNLHTDF